MVFLLRLYDGSLDQLLDDQLPAHGLLPSTHFFEEILEPVVNHCQVDDSLIGWDY